MARTQTMVQLSEQLVAELDLEAAREGRSRSAVIRTAVTNYLEQRRHDARVERYVTGYRESPPMEPDEWGDLATEADRSGHELAQRLDAEDAAQGLPW